MSKLTEERKKDMIDYNTKVFANYPIGIHGKELPKYSETTKNFWIKNDEHSRKVFSSQVDLKASHKYWAKPDLFLTSPLKGIEPPVEPLKHFKEMRTYKNQVADKVTKIDVSVKLPKSHPLDHDNEGISGELCPKKWTSKEFHEFVRHDCAYQPDMNERPSLIKSENEDLYS